MSRRPRRDIREAYLRWLEPQLRDEHGNPDKNYWDLLNIMFEREFVWVVYMDDNRMADGLDLRKEFAHDHRMNPDRLSVDELGPCSFLEVLIGISRRLAFTAGGSAPGWAWQLLGNLELQRMTDPLSPGKAARVNDIMDTCIMRTYSPDGTGGFFPLAWPDEDQTKIQIWYQMSAYVAELHPEHY